jgi:SAM-dependent methyltransferase
MVNEQFVTECWKKINKIKTVDSIFSDKSNFSTLPNYYNKAGVIYKQFHSSDGAMHFPIKLDNLESHNTKLLFQAKSIEEIININSYNSIIELGSGFGFNSIYLAGIFPEKKFLAIDITESNLKEAEARAMKLGLTNITFLNLDYTESLHLYKADLIFGVETFCYCNNLNALFKNISASLNENGRIVIYDGYERLTSQFKELTPVEVKAYRLFCYGYFLSKFQNLEDIYDAANSTNLHIELEKDYSKEILSNTRVMQKGSLKLIKYPFLTKFMIRCKIISHMTFMQSLSGLFSSYFLERNFMSYYAFVLKKGTE